MRLPKLESKYGIAKIVPVNDKFGVAKKTNYLRDGKSRNGRWILRKEDLAQSP